jgi:UDP-glucose 4-epimerase
MSIFDKLFSGKIVPNIYGDGSQYRDFIYVKDIALANIKSMNKESIKHNIFCVGTSQKVFLNDLFDIRNKNCNKNFKPNYL